MRQFIICDLGNDLKRRAPSRQLTATSRQVQPIFLLPFPFPPVKLRALSTPRCDRPTQQHTTCPRGRHCILMSFINFREKTWSVSGTGNWCSAKRGAVPNGAVPNWSIANWCSAKHGAVPNGTVPNVVQCQTGTVPTGTVLNVVKSQTGAVPGWCTAKLVPCQTGVVPNGTVPNVVQCQTGAVPNVAVPNWCSAKCCSAKLVQYQTFFVGNREINVTEYIHIYTFISLSPSLSLPLSLSLFLSIYI